MRDGTVGTREGLVRDVARQHVLEAVLRLAGEGGSGPTSDEIARHQGCDRRVEPGPSPSTRRATAPGQNVRPTTAAACRRAASGRLEEVDPRREYRLHRVGDLDRLDLSGGAPPLAVEHHLPAVDEPADDLLQEEGVPARALQYPEVYVGRQVVDVEQRADQVLGLVSGQGVERDRAVVPLAAAPRGPATDELGSRRAEEQDRRIDPLGELFQQVQQRRVGPVDVLDQGEHGRVAGERGEEASPRGTDLLSDLLRVELVEALVRVVEAHREGERRGRARASGVVAEKPGAGGPHPVERNARWVGVLDPCDVLQDLGERPVGHPVAVGEAPSAHHHVPVVRVGGRRQELLHEPALADARDRRRS